MANTKQDEEEILDNLLSEIPLSDVASVQIPSGAKVALKPITFEEEKLLINSSKTSSNPLDMLISKCVSVENDEELLFIDKVYLLFKLRQISFGNEYRFKIPCPSCGADDSYSVMIDEIPVVTLESTDPVEVTLPMCKKKAVIRLATMADEKYIGTGMGVLDNAWRFVNSVEGHDSKKIISKFIPKLPAGDVNKIISTFMCRGYGLQTEVGISCKACGSNNIIDLPLTKDFFTMS
jgi:hypothetical protein